MEKFLNKRIDKAIKFTVRAHKNQVRKTEKDIPYAYHPISVGFILREAGFSEDVVIAGILHDTIEDTETNDQDIEENFGKKVRELVESVSEDKNLPYEERKKRYLETVLAGTEETKAISIADSLQNLHCLIETVSQRGQEVWKNFTKNKELTVEHYEKKIKAILEKWDHSMAREALDKATELKVLIGK